MFSKTRNQKVKFQSIIKVVLFVKTVALNLSAFTRNSQKIMKKSLSPLK